MSTTPPEEPDPERDVHGPVALLRLLIVAVFVCFWGWLFRTGIFDQGGLMAVIFYGGPIFAFTMLPALAAWQGAWNMKAEAYNRRVAEWNAYVAEQQRLREAADEERRQHAWELDNLQDQIRRVNHEIDSLSKRRQELSR